jgi:hypothetical protein
LTEERIKKLEKAGFVWNTRNSDAQSEVEAQRRIQAQDDRWNATYRLLLEYKAKYGNCLVPKEYREVKGLASWYVIYFLLMRLHEPCAFTLISISLTLASIMHDIRSII